MKFNLRAKLLIGFGLVLGIFLIFIVFELKAEKEQIKVIQDIYEHPLTVTQSVLKANVGIVAMHRSMKDVALSTNETELEQSIAVVNQLEKEVLFELNIVESKILGDEGRKIVSDAKTAFLKWKLIRSEVIDLMKAGKQQEAAVITKGKGADHVVLLSKKNEILWKYADGKAREFKGKAEKTSKRRFERFLVVIFLAVAASLFISLFISLSISKRVEDFNKVVDRISGGDLSKKIEVKGSDEIAQLSVNFNSMTARLLSIHKELESFSYSVSHDLRAPLRSLDGFSKFLLRDYNDKLDERGKDFLNRIRKASQRMGELIDELLKLSRVTRSELIREPTDLSKLAYAIENELKKADPKRRVKFHIKDGLVVNGDKVLLRQVMVNLIGNAWKYTGKSTNAKIEFGATQRDGERAYFVQDNGSGFDMTYANKLFDAFQRLHSTDEFEGIGIGLAIVKRIINRHGGRVWGEGKVNEGATFYFNL